MLIYIKNKDFEIKLPLYKSKRRKEEKNKK